MIAAEDGGRVVSGWQMRNAHLPSRVREEHSETAYMTDRALDWIRAQGETPWVLHLSYVKPHWPYLAPAPYHALLPRRRHRPDRARPAGRHRRRASGRARLSRRTTNALSFAREEVARHVRPAYMGLVAQVDHHLGRVLDALDGAGRMRRHADRLHRPTTASSWATAGWARRSSSTTRSSACR